MSFSRKIDGSTGDDQKEVNEHQEQPHTLGPFLSSSSYLHPQHHQQPFFSPRPNSQENRVWLLDSGETSSNQKDEGGWNMVVEKEHMFDKVVTPSDVGKLNRLVIPKQHAERFFPLDSSTNYKGLLLNFEDVNGKLWRFQYSYWNSSQSYVMTKGWSRFVKEKKLDAGDIVSFQRGVGTTAKDRLFIDWRRRVNPSGPPIQLSSSSDLSFLFQNPNFINPWNYNPLVLQSFPARRNPNFMLPDPNSNPNIRTSSRSVYYQPAQQQFMMTQRSELGLGFDHPPPVPVHGKGKRLRLFGVNMDCELSEDDEDDHHPSTELTNCSSTIAGNNYSSSFSTIPYLQLSHNCAEENECNDQSTTLSGSSTHNLNSTVSNMSLDLKMSHSQEDDNDDDDH